ncbi:MAG: hypothetical protein GF401_20060 [Chitinivibrionales bacterium]|nr:hypothetical protein [Chitinivibrionales bacterium]
MQKISVFYLIISFIVSVCIAAVSDNDQLMIIAGAETHGMLFPCDCPHTPGGGLAKRAAFLSSLYAPQSRLLLDAGGFAGGGIYDSYSEGRAMDSLRTLAALKAMGHMGYDAVAVGDEELQYGGKWIVDQARRFSVPLISANCFQGNNRLAKPFVVVERGGKKYGITALTTREKLFEIDSSVTIHDPIESLRNILEEFENATDYQIILSHLGEETIPSLTKAFPQVDLIVNGHRKKTTSAATVVNNIPVMQFGFQGKALSYAAIVPKVDSISIIDKGWHDILEDMPDDSTVLELLDIPSQLHVSHREDRYDLYIMSQCPYGLSALKEFLSFEGKFSGVNRHIWFIGAVTGDTVFSSLHGEEEIEDEKAWLAVKALYPERWTEFLHRRSSSNRNNKALFVEMGLDTAQIDRWIAAKGNRELALHYNRSTRLNISASPTLFVNNVPFDYNLHAMRLAKHRCDHLEVSSSFCDSVPECIDDRDCRKPGKIGACIQDDGEGRCEFRDAQKFTLTVVREPSSYQHPEGEIIATTLELFPGVQIDTVDYLSERGKEILDRFSVTSLPFYFFGANLKKTANFDKVAERLVEKDKGFVFADNTVPQNYFPNRPLEKGKVAVLVDPVFPDVEGVLAVATAAVRDNENFVIAPLLYADPANPPSEGPQARIRNEEADRWLLIARAYPEEFAAYLDEYAKSPGSTYWFRFLDKAGIPSKKMIDKLTRPADRLHKHWESISPLNIREPVIILKDNRELIGVGNVQELKRLCSDLSR